MKVMCVLSSDDEEISLVMEAAGPEAGDAAADSHAHAADAHDDDTLSVGPDMPDLPLDAPHDPETSPPPTDTPRPEEEEEPLPAETAEREAVAEEEDGSTVREEPQVEREEEEEAAAAAPGEQQEESGGDGGGGEEEEPQAEEEAAVEEEEETQPKPDSDIPAELCEGAPPQEVPEAEGGGGGGGVPSCACQSLFVNYNSHAAAPPPARRKNRPCSLPVSELETVIASACGEPETPRSHYIRIHHLLHSLPSAQHRSLSQEEEPESGEGENTTPTSPTLKTSKEEEGQEEEEDDDTTHSPSQVRPVVDTSGTAPCDTCLRCKLNDRS